MERDNKMTAAGSSVHKPGRAVSMADVAKLAGVSRQTVSRVVNGQACVVEETRRRVMDAMDQLGFYPSFAGRSLRGGKYGCIGLCMFDITHTGNVATLEGLMSAAREYGYAVTLIEFDESESVRLRDTVRRLAELPVDGMVFNTNRTIEDFDEFEPLNGLPTIIISMKEHPRCTLSTPINTGARSLWSTIFARAAIRRSGTWPAPKTRSRRISGRAVGETRWSARGSKSLSFF